MPGLKVRASAGQERGTIVGFYANIRRREGDEFVLSDPKHYSFRWMEPLDFDPQDDYDLIPPASFGEEATTPMEAPNAVVQPESKEKTQARLTRSQRAMLRRRRKKQQAEGKLPEGQLPGPAPVDGEDSGDEEETQE